MVAVDDHFLESETRVIPREDLAEVIVQALSAPEAVNTSWDLVSKNVGEGEVSPQTPREQFSNGSCWFP